MKIEMHSVRLGPHEMGRHEMRMAAANLLPQSVPRTAWDAPNQQRWHADMQKIRLRLVGEKTTPIASHPDFQDKRLRAPERLLWDRIRQAYSVLRGRAYTRPLRQPR